jgi:phage baseplate assembly protein gpV
VQISDAELFTKLAAEVGLDAEVENGDQIHPYLIQANCTNLSLLRSRAAALGNLLFVEASTLRCVAPCTEDSPVELRWGVELSAFRPRLTTLGQVQRVVVRGWDPATRTEITGETEASAGSPAIGEARTGGELVQAAFQISAALQLTTGPVRSQAAADRLADAAARRRASQFVEAEGRCRGTPALTAGASVTIAAVGERFGGSYLVTSARHRYGAAGYHTEFQISGLNPTTLIGQLAPALARPSAPAIAIAIVTDNADPDQLGRVRLRFPWLSGEHTSDWARVAVPGGGAERGLQWLPEIDDEVLVAFEQGDITYPYVLGGLWNGVDPPPRPSDQLLADGRVQRRVLRSRSGHLLVFDDSERGGITVEDRNGNRLQISSADNRLVLRDKAENTIVLDAEKNSLAVTVKGDIALGAQGSISLEATGNLTLKGMGISINAGLGTVDIDGSLIELN